MTREHNAIMCNYKKKKVITKPDIKYIFGIN